MEFKGTKGKWKAVKLEKTDWYPERNEIQFGEDGECVCEFVADDNDAKLIASAPELLNALQSLLKSTYPNYKTLDNSIHPANLALKAINKALF